MPRRLSRGTPVLLTLAEQESFVRAVDGDADLREALESLLGIDSWFKPVADGGLTYGQKVAAYQRFVQAGVAAAPLVQAARARQELILLADQHGTRLSQADQLAVMRDELEAARREITELREALPKAPARAARRPRS